MDLNLLAHGATDVIRRGLRTVRPAGPTRPDGRSPTAPEWLVLVVNNFCNLHCRMCDVGLDADDTVFYEHLVGTHPRNMSLELLDTVLDQAADFFPRPKIGLAYTEPLIHAEILSLCGMIVERGFLCSVTTNGYLLPRLADDLVEIGVHELTVSCDGPEEVHNRIRGDEDSFAQLFRGTEQLLEGRRAGGTSRPRVQLSCTITDENYTHLVGFLEEMEGLGPDAVTFSHLNFITESMAEAHNRKSPEELSVRRSNLGPIEPAALNLPRMWEELRNLERRIQDETYPMPVNLVPSFDTLEELRTYYQHPEEFVGGRRCEDPWRILMVRADGSVNPAHGRCYDVPLGTVEEGSLTAMWNGARMRTFRQTLHEHGGSLPACARCCGVINKPPENERT